MPPKNKAKPSSSKSSQAKLPVYCIRCPDFATAERQKHENDFNLCQKDFPTSDGSKHSANDLWWGFQKGEATEEFKQNKEATLKQLLESAKTLGAWELNMTDQEVDVFKNAPRKKSEAKLNRVPITKGMLEHAVSVCYPIKSAQQKQEEKKSKKGAKKPDDAGEGSSKDAAGGESGFLPLRPAGTPSAATSSSVVESGAETDQTLRRCCTSSESHRACPQGLTSMPKVKGSDIEGITVRSVPHDPRASFPKDPIALGKSRRDYWLAAERGSDTNLTVREPLAYIALRPDLAPSTNKHEVLSNHFTVDIPKDKVLYEYHVTNMPSTASRAKRRILIADMIEYDQGLWDERDNIATDNQKKIISTVPLYSNESTPIGTEVHAVPVNNYNPGTREKPAKLQLFLNFVARHDLNGLRDFVAGKNESYRDNGAAEAMNIVIAKAVTTNDPSSNTFRVGNNRFYFRPGWSSLFDDTEPESIGLISIRGYYSAIKPAMGSVLLNVNTVTSAFYNAQSLDKYLDGFFAMNGFPNDPVEKIIPWKPSQERLWAAAQRHLPGLRVRINFSRKAANKDPDIDNDDRRTKTLASLGDRPKVQRFYPDGKLNGNTKTVYEHIQSKYQYRMPNGKEVDDPLNGAVPYKTANVGKRDPPNQKFYYPQQLDVLSDQPYRRPVPPGVTANMIKVARRMPEENCKAILGEGVTSLGLHKTTLPPMLQSLGIKISPNMVRVPARLIKDQPQIQYANNHLANPNNKGFWDKKPHMRFMTTSNRYGSTGKVQFFYPGKSLKYPSLMKSYADNFLHHHNMTGMQKLELLDVKRTYEVLQDWAEDKLKAYLGTFSKRIDLAVVIFRDQSAENRNRYATFKIVTDQELGMKSICFNESKLTSSHVNQNRSFNPTKSAPPEIGSGFVDYMRNITMKLNIRCGNFNHTVRREDLQMINRGDTIVLGADVTHPAPGGIRKSPSIAAVVGSVDAQFGLFPGSMRLNPSGQEWINDMEDMVCERLRAWSGTKKTLPDNVLYYRDGVGDSYFPQIRKTELNAIKAAWARIFQEKHPKEGLPDNSLPRITALVVTKRHHTRLYPRSIETGVASPETEAKGNCRSGTVVDSGITSPYYFDFFLQSHNVLAGSGKPAHYIVLENDMDFNAAQLQDTTFNLCHTYGKSTTAVSYAPPAYYADRLCERGRLYLKPLLDNAGQYRNATEDQVMQAAQGVFNRWGATLNPWHIDHDGKMFWM